MIQTRTTAWVGLLLAAALLTACGNSATGTPVAAGPAVSSSDSDGLPTAIPTDDGDTGAGGGASGQNTMPAGEASVRIANTYLPAKGGKTTAIDVWSGYPINGGKKILTVPYGTVSTYVVPPVSDSSQNFTLTFYPAGSTSDDASLGNQGENGAPGLKLTILVAATDPTDVNAQGASIKVYADAIGPNPGNSGFSKVILPKPAAGKSVLLLDALSLAGRAGVLPNSGFTPSGTDGKCLPYFEPNTDGSGFSSKLHDMSTDNVDLFGDSEDLVYQVSPGSQDGINQLKTDETVTAACADKPVVGPFDPKLAAGQGAYGFLYGTDLSHAKVLLVPVG